MQRDVETSILFVLRNAQTDTRINEFEDDERQHAAVDDGEQHAEELCPKLAHDRSMTISEAIAAERLGCENARQESTDNAANRPQ